MEDGRWNAEIIGTIVMNESDRAYMFMLCLAVRSVLAYLAYTFPKASQRVAPLAAIPVVTWLYYYFIKGKPVGFAGGPAWWSELRIAHAALYALYVLYAHRKLSYAWIPLALDVILGAIGWLAVR